VHQSQAGCVIGRGGEKIKELRIKHSLDMKVYSECAPMSTERVCQMKGKPSDIVACLKEVLALLESAPPKGMNRPYDPHNFDEFLASQYGGFCNDKRGGGGGGGGGGGNFGNNRGGGGGGNFGNNNNNRNNNNGGGGFNNNNGGGNRGGNFGNDRGGQGGNRGGNNMNRGGAGGGGGGGGGGRGGGMGGGRGGGK
jgi:heterogeneous nuclear ribonucleoprotein K